MRLLAVNLSVVLIPAAGLEFARIYERQLLDGLERDMRNQATLTRVFLEDASKDGNTWNVPELEALLARAATSTRTRIRVVTQAAGVLVDSHRNGPPEGHEPKPPLLGRSARGLRGPALPGPDAEPPTPILERPEVVSALGGALGTRTRIAEDPPAVFLFLAEPIRQHGVVTGAVYLTRSTTPVLLELYRIRRGLVVVLGLAVAVSALLTLGLAWTISRPLERLARAARRIAEGDTAVELPGGGGEIGELSRAFLDMTKKLEARQRYISEFAADVAHEFKSPLTSIRGAAELLSEGAADDPEARRRFLENISLDAKRLDRLVSRLLELSRIDASDAPPIALALEPLVRRVVDRLKPTSPALVLRYESSIPLILGRELDLETMLLNVLDNAIRVSPAASPIEVQVSGRAHDKEVLISIRDHGPGIAAEHIPKIFERFFSTELEGEGTGLGLAIVDSVVRAHGGSVRVESALGQGTKFVICLPVRLRSHA